jgi:hypothetical protein
VSGADAPFSARVSTTLAPKAFSSTLRSIDIDAGIVRISW